MRPPAIQGVSLPRTLCFLLVWMASLAGCDGDPAETGATGAGIRTLRSEPAYFGSFCQSSFQNGWQVSLPNVQQRCNWFNAQLENTDISLFQLGCYDHESWEETSDDAYAETVDLLWVSTHGGISSDGGSARWAMYGEGVLAHSAWNGFHCHTVPFNYCHYSDPGMKLGNEGRGLSILAQYSCMTLSQDGGMAAVDQRWRPAFNGGLRIVTGSYHELFDYSTLTSAGEVFAEKLQATWTIDDAWENALSDWAADNDIAVLSKGTDSADCVDRLEYMTWYNFADYLRLGVDASHVFCEFTWVG